MHLRALPATTNGKPAVLGWFSVWQFAGRRSEDLAGEDFLEVGVRVERLGNVAGKCTTFFGDALVQRGSEKSAEVVEVHFALLVGDTWVARPDSGLRGGDQEPILVMRLMSL